MKNTAFNSPPAPSPAEALERPDSVKALFWSFSWLALQGFGGVLAIVQAELVDRKRWLTREQFVEDWAVAQVMPGPNVVNLSLMIGGRFFGLRGAIAALAGMLLIPLSVALVLMVAVSGFTDNASVQGALRGLGAVSAGLIAATGLKLTSALTHNPLGRWACVGLGVGTFAAVALLRWPLVWVLLGMAPLSWLWAVHALRQVARHALAASGKAP